MNYKIWQTADGRLLDIDTMETEHIINCIKALANSYNLNPRVDIFETYWFNSLTKRDIFNYLEEFARELNSRWI